MLDIASFATLTDQGMMFSQTQASEFAKGIAGDFNPIHDVGGKRFCVPGDLLFASLLNRYGVYQRIHVDLVALVLPQSFLADEVPSIPFLDGSTFVSIAEQKGSVSRSKIGQYRGVKLAS